MTISKLSTQDLYRGDGTTNSFPISIDIEGSSDNFTVKKVSAAGVETLQTLTTHYTWSGKNITFTTGNTPAATEFVLIEPTTNFQQTLDLTPNGTVPAENLENALDKLSLGFQSINTSLARASLSVLGGTSANLIGTIAIQDANDVSLTGGTVTGITDLAVADGGTGSSTAAGARTNLGIDSMATQNSNTVTITGGTIAGTTPDINSLTADGTPDMANDVVMSYDVSTSTNKKVKLSNLDIATFELVNDSTPQLGGDLDLNSNSLTFPSVTVTDCLDEDTLSSDSATALATQQSIKAYTDSSISTEEGRATEIFTYMFSAPILNNGDGGKMYRAISSTVADAAHTVDRISNWPETFSNSEGHAIQIRNAGTISNLYCHFYPQQTSLPASTISVDFTIYKRTSGDSTTAGPTVALSFPASSGAVQNGSDTSTNLSVSAGDIIQVRVEVSPTSYSNSFYGSWSCLFTPS